MFNSLMNIDEQIKSFENSLKLLDLKIERVNVLLEELIKLVKAVAASNNPRT
jgi:hypothetical protein